MNEHAELAIRALYNMIGDDTARARQAFRNKTHDQMNEQWGMSGKTCAEILAEYEAHDAKVRDAIDWVKAKVTNEIIQGPRSGPAVGEKRKQVRERASR